MASETLPGPASRVGAIARFLRCFAHPTPRTDEEREILLGGGDGREATLYQPRARGRRPAWILLHGLTVTGRHHEAVRRMARGLAAAGHVALAPEVPRWRALRMVAAEAQPAFDVALDHLARRDDFDSSRVGLIGFSVAGTWAVQLAARDGERLAAVVAIGAYGDLRSVVRAMVTGEHESDGRRLRFRVEPYGRWILGANLLPIVDTEAWGRAPERVAAADALHRLARVSGLNGADGDSSVYDALAAQLGAALSGGARRAWELLAAPSTELVPDARAGEALADALADAALRADPALDPAGRLDSLHVPVVLLHGRGDRLLPFTESLRLARLLPAAVPRHVGITRLFGHTKTSEATAMGPLRVVREAWRFARTIDAILHPEALRSISSRVGRGDERMSRGGQHR